jgi:hypothetical protein
VFGVGRALRLGVARAELRIVHRVASLVWERLFGFAASTRRRSGSPTSSSRSRRRCDAFLRGYFLGDGTASQPDLRHVVARRRGGLSLLGACGIVASLRV